MRATGHRQRGIRIRSAAPLAIAAAVALAAGPIGGAGAAGPGQPQAAKKASVKI